MRRPLRVGVNLTWLVAGEVGGTESYATRLLGGVAELGDRDLEVTLFVLPGFEPAHPGLVEAFRTRCAPVRGHRRIARVAAESSWLAVAGARCDVVHHLGGTVPPLHSGRPIVTIHDVQVLDHPEHFSTLKRRYLTVMVPAAVRWAARVSTPSQSAAERLARATGLDVDDIWVVPHAVPAPTFAPSSPSTAPPGTTAIGGVAAGAASGRRPFLLYPAITHPHKGHLTLLEALARVPTPRRPRLVLTGTPGAAHRRVLDSVVDLGLSDDVEHRGWVSEAALGELYQKAAGLVFPSEYEGFGAPVIEAMAAGTPVAASAGTSLPEVAGDAAVLVPPGDPRAWAAAIELLTGPGGRDRVAAGRARAARFAPSRSAGRLVELWRSVGGTPPG